MKQLIAIAMLLVCQWSFAGTTKSGSFSPIGVSLWDNLCWPEDATTIGGVDLSLGGVERNQTSVYGLAFAPLYGFYGENANDKGSVCGVQVGLGAQCTSILRGVQVGLGRQDSGTLRGVQISLLLAGTQSGTGLQAGLATMCDRCDTLLFQAGLLNCSDSFKKRERDFGDYGHLSVGLWNFCAGCEFGALNESGMLQVGLFNYGGTFQIGLINCGDNYQLGLINIDGTACLGLFNSGKKTHFTFLIGW